ncbi:WD40-repeat-containing domain protein [Pseudoneurospora amorphoporcata]|uniref:WD40-repeat-containing domain protein n=1 Tax=Pseudoneurospora amorphoporcata TaxID=241081 RepID=A0AAN6SF93_9PEZI|nr:WD40-repeat-containing domain protein [Pseudoneurospora amorphoporcata]
MARDEIVDDVDVNMEEDDAEAEQRLINEEYKIWKKNSPFLYDMMLSTALEWPTLTTQWFPDVKNPKDKSHTVHRLLLGTHTAEGKPNHLQIAEVEIPKMVELNPRDYDEERGEIGGYGSKASSGEPLCIRFKITQKIDHPGEVNKARYQPQNPDIIATLAVDGRVLIFDRTKHSITPSGTPSPQLELIGHKEEGFGLNWNPHEEGCLATGSEDKTVLLWDLKTYQGTSKQLKYSRKYMHHSHIVNDVQHHPMVKSWIGTVSDDLTLQILDVRRPETDKAAIVARNGHSDAINALAFNPRVETIIATASADKTIGIWDMRNMKSKVHTLEGHQDAVTSLEWHPTESAVLGSGSYDRRLLFWDISRVGDEQTQDDAEDGPPELLFMHGGHTNHLADFSWNRNDPWLVCSAAEDNLLQIWKVANSIVSKEPADMSTPELDDPKPKQSKIQQQQEEQQQAHDKSAEQAATIGSRTEKGKGKEAPKEGSRLQDSTNGRDNRDGDDDSEDTSASEQKGRGKSKGMSVYESYLRTVEEARRAAQMTGAERHRKTRSRTTFGAESQQKEKQ